MTADTITIRSATAGDRGAIVALLAAALSWVPDDLFDRFFTWKHEAGPFGRSPAWVATDGARIVGYRTFLRWELEHPDGRVRRAARAVDTATHPDYQGRGIFSRLTLHGLDSLLAEGVDLIFNTPNERSRPGYLKMGWVEVGRLATTARPSGGRGLARMARSRVPADRWSLPTAAARPAPDVLADERVSRLLAELAPARGLRTRRSREYLAWRYGFDALAYRVVTLGTDPTEGLAVVRVRRRGTATEAAVCEILAPGNDRTAERALTRKIARLFDVNYAVRIDATSPLRHGYVRLPRQGPTLTYRPLNDETALGAPGAWQLQLGDIELM